MEAAATRLRTKRWSKQRGIRGCSSWFVGLCPPLILNKTRVSQPWPFQPDFHSKTAGSWTDGLDTINRAQAIATWETMADLLKDEWNVFIADIFNEPHDVDNNEWSEWVQFCEDAAAAIWAKGVNWMVAVEGTNWQCDVINWFAHFLIFFIFLFFTNFDFDSVHGARTWRASGIRGPPSIWKRTEQIGSFGRPMFMERM